MFSVTEDHDTVPLFAHLGYDMLRCGHIGAGGIDDSGILGFQLTQLIFRDTVGTDHHGLALRRLFKLLGQSDIEPLFESVDLIFVVDQRTVGDCSAMLFGDLYRPFDTKTEAVTRRKLYLHHLIATPP